MDERIQKLDGSTAVKILRKVARNWIEKNGVEAFVVIDQIRRTFRDRYDNPPQWLLDPPENASKELIAVSKLALSSIIDGDQAEARGWVEDELAEMKQARGQVLDPLSLAIIGSTIIGIVLASRVKKIGNVEFYEGVPKETVEIVKHASGIVVPKGG